MRTLREIDAHIAVNSLPIRVNNAFGHELEPLPT